MRSMTHDERQCRKMQSSALSARCSAVVCTVCQVQMGWDALMRAGPMLLPMCMQNNIFALSPMLLTCRNTCQSCGTAVYKAGALRHMLMVSVHKIESSHRWHQLSSTPCIINIWIDFHRTFVTSLDVCAPLNITGGHT